MIRRISKFARLPRQKRGLLLMAFVLLVMMRLALYIIPFRVMWPFFSQPRPERKAADPLFIQNVAWAIDTAGNFVPGAKCLAKALVTRIILSYYGHSCLIRLGVLTNDEGKFQAHAWVERDGNIIVGNLSNLDAFSALPSA